jgi:hypothetical protein
MWGAFSDERMGVSFTVYNIFTFYMLLHECIYTIIDATSDDDNISPIACRKPISIL